MLPYHSYATCFHIIKSQKIDNDAGSKLESEEQTIRHFGWLKRFDKERAKKDNELRRMVVAFNLDGNENQTNRISLTLV